ncbi:MAG: molecular chaperone DnaJ [Leptolyngbya sp. LCM1.Bin17]|nr:MAG: molecular chaperone DnaJ [Leptolyngbya sp. LCM1.Bin17]
MSQPAFSPAWLNRYTDPYAILGVSVAADERRILKRYRVVAKLLHPDTHIDTPTDQQAFVSQVFSKLVNPAYQRLKQDKGRSEVLATLRFKVRRLTRDGQLQPSDHLSRQLLGIPEAEVELFYEHALEQLIGNQYASLEAFEANTPPIAELNLVYLRRKMGDPVIREKRTGLITAPVPKTSVANPEPPKDNGTPGLAYADRHFQRAQEYLKAKAIPAAIQELKDALRIDPKNHKYHCLMGQAYLLSNLPGMAKVHFKQALRLNPKNAVALKYAQQLKLDIASIIQPQSGAEAKSTPSSAKRPLFGRIFSK